MLNALHHDLHNQITDMPEIPAAGSPVIIPVPTGTSAELIALDLRIQTDVNVANRQFQISLIRPSATVIVATVHSVIPASTDLYIHFGVGLTPYAVTSGVSLIEPIVPGLIARTGDTWQVTAINLQPTDQLGPTHYALNTWPLAE